MSNFKQFAPGECDLGIKNTIKKINDKGFTTLSSCSGLQADHKEKVFESFVVFSALDQGKTYQVEDAARKAGMYTHCGPIRSTRGEDFCSLNVYFRTAKARIDIDTGEIFIDKQLLSDEQIRERWAQFDNELEKIQAELKELKR